MDRFVGDEPEPRLDYAAILAFSPLIIELSIIHRSEDVLALDEVCNPVLADGRRPRRRVACIEDNFGVLTHNRVPWRNAFFVKVDDKPD
jgi:hypothetical protein